MSKPYDLIVWGATGFTGRLVAEYLVGAVGAGERVRWAVAGRNKAKLAALRQHLAQRAPAAAALPTLLADSLDAASLASLVQQTRVIISAVGPYKQFGTPLVAACAAHGTHYADITGEVTWMRAMIDAYDAPARASGARIVHACGFDSIPSDLGTLMMQTAMAAQTGGPADEVKYLLTGSRGGVGGGSVATLLQVLADVGEPKTRRLLANPYALVPARRPAVRQPADQQGARWDPDFGAWTGPFIMASINTRVVHRSNALLGAQYGSSFRYSEAMGFGRGVRGRLRAALFAAGYRAVYLAGTAAPARRLLQAVLPAPGDGPPRRVRESGYFRVRLLAWRHPAAGGPPVRLQGTVVGVQDPGYGETAKMAAEAGLCLALDEAHLAISGGILTPAAAMGMRLVDRLRAAGMTFEVATVNA